MKIAIISDIHSNLVALDAVLEDIAEQGADLIYCLGDVVGYGPRPSECLSRVRELCRVIIQGNHDFATLYEPLGFNKPAKEAAIWTKKVIKPVGDNSPEDAVRKANWDLLAGAPKKFEDGDILCVHGSPRDPVFEYVEETDAMDMGFGPTEKVVEIMELVNGVCLIGHTHRPGVIDEQMQWHGPAEADMHWPVKQGKCVFNVGSVGQPRDHDPRACYATMTETELCWRRVKYEVEETAYEIYQNSELDDRLGERLLLGR
jgi:predicted phosphodiesterase